MLSRGIRLAGCTAASLCAFGAVASAASGPPAPTATNRQKVETVAAGLGTPTAFAFGGGNVFEADGGIQGKHGVPGGVFLLKDGKATKLAGSPPFVSGLTYHKGTLYVAAGSQIFAWSGWDGTKFATQKSIITGPKGFQGFGGIAFAKNGRLYAGALLAKGDHGPAKSPFQYDVVSFKPGQKKLKVVASGIRQPWQMVFPKGSNSPYVSDLGQDKGAKNPPDFVLRVKQGDNYGFPKCNWTNPGAKACKGMKKPFQFFAPHTDVMGLGIIGKRLYMSEFLGNGGKSGLVQSMPLKGGKAKTLLTGFQGPIVGLGTNGGFVYVGAVGLSAAQPGVVYRVKAS